LNRARRYHRRSRRSRAGVSLSLPLSLSLSLARSLARSLTLGDSCCVTSKIFIALPVALILPPPPPLSPLPPSPSAHYGSVSHVRRFLRARRRLAAILRGSIGRTNTNGRFRFHFVTLVGCFSFLFIMPGERVDARGRSVRREARDGLSHILLPFRTFVNFRSLSLSPPVPSALPLSRATRSRRRPAMADCILSAF